MSVAGDEAEAPLPRRGDDGRETGGDARSSDRVSVFITDYSYCGDNLRQKVEDSPTQNGWDIFFVAVAV